MNLLDADRLNEAEPFVPRRFVVEFTEKSNGDWYMNLHSYQGEHLVGGSFIDRYSYAPPQAIKAATKEIRYFFARIREVTSELT